MRKAFAIFFILCANIILLAHAVIPHHHHDSIACFVIPIETDKHHDCDHHDAENHHQHDTECDGDCCLLNDLLAIVPDGYKQEQLFCCPASEQPIPSDINFAGLLSGQDQVHECTLNVFKEPPFLIYSASYTPGSINGLRAPPTC